MEAVNVQVATKAFQDAKTYDKVRHTYSSKSVRLVLTKLGILASDGQTQAATDSNKGPVTVLELAAGTGKFTEVLVKTLKDTNVRFVSSEPLESMGKVFEENFPNVEFIRCRSEKIPLPGSSVHAIVAGCASHFVSNQESYAEMARVLVPGGGVGFVNQGMDPIVIPWCLKIYDMLASCYQRKGINIKFDGNGADVGWQSELVKSGKFGEIMVDSSDRYSEPSTEEEILELIMSFGAFECCKRPEREKIRERVQEILKQNYSGAGKTMTELSKQSFIFWAMKKQ